MIKNTYSVSVERDNQDTNKKSYENENTDNLSDYIVFNKIALVSPNGTIFKLLVDDNGNLITEQK